MRHVSGFYVRDKVKAVKGSGTANPVAKAILLKAGPVSLNKGKHITRPL